MAAKNPSMLECLSSEKIWLDKHMYANAEKNYQIQLAKNSVVCARQMQESENNPSISNSKDSPSKENISREDQYKTEMENDLKTTVSLTDSEKSLEVKPDSVDSAIAEQEITQKKLETDLLPNEKEKEEVATTQIIVTDHDHDAMKQTAGPVSTQDDGDLSDTQTASQVESASEVLEDVEKSDLSEEIQNKDINEAGNDSEQQSVKIANGDLLKKSVEETVSGKEEDNTALVDKGIDKVVTVPTTDSSSELRDEDSNSGNTIKSDESIASTSYSKTNEENKIGNGQLKEPIASSSGSNYRNDNKRPNMRVYENGRQKNGTAGGGQLNKTIYQPQDNISSEDKDNTRQRRNMKPWHKRRYRQPNDENAENTNCEGSNGTKNITVQPQPHAPARQWRNNRHRGGLDIEKLNTEIMNLKKTLATQARDIKQAVTKEFEQKLSIQETMWKNHMQRNGMDLRDVRDSQEEKFKDLVTAMADIRRVESEFHAHKHEYRSIICEDVNKMLREHNLEIQARLQQHEEGVNRMVENRIRSFELEQMNNSDRRNRNRY